MIGNRMHNYKGRQACAAITGSYITGRHRKVLNSKVIYCGFNCRCHRLKLRWAWFISRLYSVRYYTARDKVTPYLRKIFFPSPYKHLKTRITHSHKY